MSEGAKDLGAERPQAAQEAPREAEQEAPETVREGSESGAGEPGEGSSPDHREENAEEAGPQDWQAAYEKLHGEYQALQEAHKELEERHRQLQNLYLRLQADFDNFRRRVREQEEQRRREAAEQVVTDLLPVVDNLERALKAAREGGDGPAGGQQAGIVSGVEMILRQMQQVLTKQGVEPVPGVGAPFDPRWHNAVAQEEAVRGAEEDAASAGEGGGPEAASDGPLIVVEEFQKGYLLGSKVIRPSMVKVGRMQPDAVGDGS